MKKALLTALFVSMAAIVASCDNEKKAVLCECWRTCNGNTLQDNNPMQAWSCVETYDHIARMENSLREMCEASLAACVVHSCECECFEAPNCEEDECQ